MATLITISSTKRADAFLTTERIRKLGFIGSKNFLLSFTWIHDPSIAAFQFNGVPKRTPKVYKKIVTALQVSLKRLRSGLTTFLLGFKSYALKLRARNCWQLSPPQGVQTELFSVPYP